METFETIIVGGGPAGSTCGWVLKKNHRDVAILDTAEFPRTKLCAGWVTPKVLTDLELEPESVPGLVTLTRMNLHWKRSKRFLPLPAKQYSIRRSEFDHFLLERSGIKPIVHHVRDITHDGTHYVIDGAFRCKYLVGAGGTQCPVKKQFFSTIHNNRDEIAIARELEYTPKHKIQPECHLWWFYPKEPGYAWYVPKQNAVNIGFGYFKRSRTDAADVWDTFLRLLVSQNLIDMDDSIKPQGWSYYLFNPRQQMPERENCYLIGDALGLATRDLGEGIGPAVESGIFCAKEILGTGVYRPRDVSQTSMAGGPLVRKFLSPLR